MAKVFGPLFSLKASGDIGGVIQFVCGHFARKKPSAINNPTPVQVDQRKKFADGIYAWTWELTEDDRQAWRLFITEVKKNKDCASIIGEVTGYNLFMMFWLREGKDGWPDYPAPPVWAPSWYQEWFRRG